MGGNVIVRELSSSPSMLRQRQEAELRPRITRYLSGRVRPPVAAKSLHKREMSDGKILEQFQNLSRFYS